MNDNAPNNKEQLTLWLDDKISYLAKELRVEATLYFGSLVYEYPVEAATSHLRALRYRFKSTLLMKLRRLVMGAPYDDVTQYAADAQTIYTSREPPGWKDFLEKYQARLDATAVEEVRGAAEYVTPVGCNLMPEHLVQYRQLTREEKDKARANGKWDQYEKKRGV